MVNAEAFHHDANNRASRVSTIDEFHGLLAERMQQRMGELQGAFNKFATKMIYSPSEPPDNL